MAKKDQNNIFNISFTERDSAIVELEFQRSDIEEDLEDAIKEFIKVSHQGKFKKKTKKIPALLRDAKNPDKVR